MKIKSCENCNHLRTRLRFKLKSKKSDPDDPKQMILDYNSRVAVCNKGLLLDLGRSVKEYHYGKAMGDRRRRNEMCEKLYKYKDWAFAGVCREYDDNPENDYAGVVNDEGKYI